MFRLVLTGILALCAAGPITAGPIAAGPTATRPAAGASDTSAPIVTEEEFLRALDASHPAVRAAAQAVEEAESERIAAATLQNPMLGVTREDPSGPVEQTDWTLSWQLPQPERALQARALEHLVTAAEARRRLALTDLRSSLREVYARWALASARREVITEQARRLESLADRQAHRAELGEAAGLEARRLRLAVAQLRTRIAIAEDGRLEAEADARAANPDLLARAVPKLPELPDTAPPAEDPMLLQATRAEKEAASLQQQASRRLLRAPQVTVGWQRQETGLESLDGPILGLRWSLPLFDRKQAEQVEAEARLAGADSRHEISQRQVRSQHSTLEARYQTLRDAVAAAEAPRRDARSVLDGIEAAFRHGEASLTDLLETVRSVAEIELAHLDLYGTALATHRALEHHQDLGISSSATAFESAKGTP